MKIQYRVRLQCQILGLALLALCAQGAARNVFAQDMAGMPGMAEAHKQTIPSTSLTVTVGGKTQTFSLSEIAAMPHETVSVMNSHLKKTESYSGVPLAALLDKMGMPFEKANEHPLMKSYWIAEGTDGYKTVVSAYEALSVIHADTVMVADSVDGQPLQKDGAIKLVISGDKRPQRWVQNLKSLTLKSIE
jgi:hypothetical protein